MVIRIHPLTPLRTTLNSGHMATPHNPSTHDTSPRNVTPSQRSPPLLSSTTRARNQWTSLPRQPAWAFSTLPPCTRQSVRTSLGVRGAKVSVYSFIRSRRRRLSSHRVPSPISNSRLPNPAVNFDNQVVLSQSSLAQANPYYPVPVLSPPWVHPSPSSDSTPPTSNSPSSTLAQYAAAPISPAPVPELLPPHAVVDARAQEASEDLTEPAPQSPLATRSTQATGRRPGACSRCKKLKVRAHSIVFIVDWALRASICAERLPRCVVLLAPIHAPASGAPLAHMPVS
jgi:hypothetical protein